MTAELKQCPICKGTKRQPYIGSYRKPEIFSGYDKETNTLPCENCGGQYQGRSGPTGEVPLRPDGTPCIHEYRETGPVAQRYRGWHEYTCIHCKDQHNIDSGD